MCVQKHCYLDDLELQLQTSATSQKIIIISVYAFFTVYVYFLLMTEKLCRCITCTQKYIDAHILHSDLCKIQFGSDLGNLTAQLEVHLYVSQRRCMYNAITVACLLLHTSQQQH